MKTDGVKEEIWSMQCTGVSGVTMVMTSKLSRMSEPEHLVNPY